MKTSTVTKKMKNNNSPRISNTGAVNTHDSGLNTCVDWIQATFQVDQIDQIETIITDVLEIETELFHDMDRGNFGYRSCLKYSGISIYYDGKEGMGIHLMLSGTGCRTWETTTNQTIDILIKNIVDHGGKFSRLDLAIDDIGNKAGDKPYFTVEKVKRMVKQGLVLSKFKSAISIEKITIETGKVDGETIYFGSEKSRVRIRIYDKAREQGQTWGHWIRTETQLRDERAERVGQMIANGNVEIGKVIRGVLANYIRFLKKGSGKNRSRWETASFWVQYLNNVEPIKLYVRPPLKTIEDKIRHLSKQYGKSMAMIAIAKEGEMNVFYDMIRKGERKITRKDIAEIEEYKRAQNIASALDSMLIF